MEIFLVKPMILFAFILKIIMKLAVCRAVVYFFLSTTSLCFWVNISQEISGRLFWVLKCCHWPFQVPRRWLLSRPGCLIGRKLLHEPIYLQWINFRVDLMLRSAKIFDLALPGKFRVVLILWSGKKQFFFLNNRWPPS